MHHALNSLSEFYFLLENMLAKPDLFFLILEKTNNPTWGISHVNDLITLLIFVNFDYLIFIFHCVNIF